MYSERQACHQGRGAFPCDITYYLITSALKEPRQAQRSTEGEQTREVLTVFPTEREAELRRDGASGLRVRPEDG